MWDRGVVLERDSIGFLEADKYLSYQYIVCPWLLEFCQDVFGKAHYLDWDPKIQGFLALVLMHIHYHNMFLHMGL